MKRYATLFFACLLIGLPFCTDIGATKSSGGLVKSSFESIIGDWQSTSFGQQILSAKNDGTAILKMHLGTMAAVLYGREITLQLSWKVDGNTLTQHIVGGSPEKSVRKLVQKYGENFTYRILEVTKDHLTVEDASTGKTCCWNSVASNSQHQ